MRSVPQQLTSFFKSNSGVWFASGAIQRMNWQNRNGSLAVPRSIVRRLEELVEDGTLKVEIRERHAWYTYAKEIKERRVEIYLKDGIRYAREVYV